MSDERPFDQDAAARDGDSPRPVRSARTVRGHDGRVRPYDPARIEEAVRRAQANAGESDPTFAREVSGVVGLALETRFPSPRRRPPERGGGLWSEPEPDLFSYRVPSVDELLDLVEETLVQMGRAAIAKAFILDRDRRGRARRALEVHGPAQRAPEAAARALDVDSGPLDAPWQRSSWDKGRLARSLVARCDLPLELAEEVAERVEERLVMARFKSLTPSLIDAFVEAELLAMGYAEEARRRASFFLPREAVDQWVRAGAERQGAERLLEPLARRLVFEELLPRHAVLAIHEGTIYVERAASPLQPLVRSLPQSLVHTGPADLRLLGGLAPFLPAGGGELVLRELELPVADGATREERARATSAWLEALASLAQSAGCRLSLADPVWSSAPLESVEREPVKSESMERESEQSGPPEHGLLDAPIEAGVAPANDPSIVHAWLDALVELGARSADAPRLYLSVERLGALAEDDAAERALERLSSEGLFSPYWQHESESWLGPGIRRAPDGCESDGARACVSAVSVNLPRLARRAGAWREDLFFEHLVNGIEQGIEALAAIERAAAEAAARHVPLREQRSYALTPVGLIEAVRILSDGSLSPEVGARILSLFDEATRRFAAERGLDVVVSPYFGAHAAAAFAKADADERREQQARLFPDLPRPELVPALPYTSGFPPAPALRGVETDETRAAAAAWSAEVYGRLRAGVLYSTRADGEFAPRSLLEAARELARARRAVEDERQPSRRDESDLFHELPRA